MYSLFFQGTVITQMLGVAGILAVCISVYFLLGYSEAPFNGHVVHFPFNHLDCLADFYGAS